MSEADMLLADLLQLKFQMEDYVNREEFTIQKNFGHFLKEYFRLSRKKRNEFAVEIGIHETLLSQLINNRRVPGENILIRLELHSNNSIPASYWYRLVQKEKEHFIKTNQDFRKSEKKFVTNILGVPF